MLRRWSEFRRRQRQILRASNAPTARAGTTAAEDGTPATQGSAPAAQDETQATQKRGDESDEQQLADDLVTGVLPFESERGSARRRDYGTAGHPLNRQSPFYIGFVGAFGVLVAYVLVRALSDMTQVITLLVVAFFLTLALNPLVEALNRRGLRRPLSVAIVFVGLVAVFTALGFVVVPPAAQQGTMLAESAPKYVDNLLNNRLVQQLDSHYHVVDTFQRELQKRVTDGDFMSGVFGGVFGFGKAV